MRKTNKEMHDGVGQAISDLRRIMCWSQRDLAEAMHAITGKSTGSPVVKQMISRWETGKLSPSAEHRSALARVTYHLAAGLEADAKDDMLDLAMRFSATLHEWQFYGAMKRREKQGGCE